MDQSANQRRSRGNNDRGRKAAPRALIRHLAQRDGAVFWLFGPRGPLRVFRCGRCVLLRANRDLMVGHIVALADGGRDDESNRMLECRTCNLADAATRNMEPTNFSQAAVLARDRGRHKRRRARELRERRRPPFGNIPVYHNNTCIAYTSTRRARYFVRLGRAVAREDGGIRMLQLPAGTNPIQNYFPNVCARCGATEGLQRHWIYPKWHPAFYADHLDADHVRPVCTGCTDVFEICVAAEMTRCAASVIPALVEDLDRLRELKDLAAELWGRRNDGVELAPDLLGEAYAIFGVDAATASLSGLRDVFVHLRTQSKIANRRAGAQVARHLLEARFEFLGAFERVRTGLFRLEDINTDELPSYATGITGVTAEDLDELPACPASI